VSNTGESVRVNRVCAVRHLGEALARHL
jgi:hypothetical protein